MIILPEEYAAIFLALLFSAQLVNCSRHVFPTPTFSGLRAAQVGIEILPTISPWSPSEILKRLSGDPAICGWVDGNGNDTVSCNSGYTCAAFSTFVGCCSTGAAGCEVLYTTCFDIVGQTCDASCSADRGALQCGQPVPYCALYRYTSGSVGYGCAGYAGYNKTVLETSTAAVIPFGQSATTTSSSSTSSISSTSSTSSSPTSTLAATMTPSATAAANNLLLISGGAIAGIVVASVLVLAAIGGLIWFFLRRRRTNQRQAAEAAQSSHPSYPYQDRYIYAQYAKNDPSTLSSPRSRANHSRDPSDQYAGSHSELGGRSVSPQTIMSPTFSDGGHILPAELPAMDEVSLGGNVSKQT